ncbi:hypothetical protein QFZ71_003179 [Streptomyces sp. V2I9]|nr:hypothetical protein [Streptomyces sp. V2I9]
MALISSSTTSNFHWWTFSLRSCIGTSLYGMPSCHQNRMR